MSHDLKRTKCRLKFPFPRRGAGSGNRVPKESDDVIILRTFTIVSVDVASGSKVHVGCFACSNSGGVERRVTSSAI